MPRLFVIVTKTVTVVSDFHDDFVEIHETAGRDRAAFPEVVPLSKNGVERILGKDVFDIGDEQLLMLLFVMESDREDRFDLTDQLFIGAFE